MLGLSLRFSPKAPPPAPGMQAVEVKGRAGIRPARERRGVRGQEKAQTVCNPYGDTSQSSAPPRGWNPAHFSARREAQWGASDLAPPFFLAQSPSLQSPGMVSRQTLRALETSWEFRALPRVACGSGTSPSTSWLCAELHAARSGRPQLRQWEHGCTQRQGDSGGDSGLHSPSCPRG